MCEVWPCAVRPCSADRCAWLYGAFVNDRTGYSVVTTPADCTALSRTDRLVQIRAAEIALRRAIVQSLPPGEEREKLLAWLATVAAAALDSTRHGSKQETTELESHRNRT
jgi:hypothetical protein